MPRLDYLLLNATKATELFKCVEGKPDCFQLCYPVCFDSLVMGRLPVAVDGLSFLYGAVEPQLMRSGIEFAVCVVSADSLPQHLRVVQALGGVEWTGPRRPRLKRC